MAVKNYEIKSSKYMQGINTGFVFSFAEIARIGDGKKIVSLEYIAEEQLIMVIAGRQRQVKLVPVRALGGDDVEWIKVGTSFVCWRKKRKANGQQEQKGLVEDIPKMIKTEIQTQAGHIMHRTDNRWTKKSNDRIYVLVLVIAS